MTVRQVIDLAFRRHPFFWGGYVIPSTDRARILGACKDIRCQIANDHHDDASWLVNLIEAAVTSQPRH